MSETSTVWRVQVGKGDGSYTTKYVFSSEQQAILYFNSLNTHSGNKKRLVNPSGKVTAIVLS